MISNHYAMTWGHEYNWLILIVLSLAGALIRVYFVQRHHGKQTPIPLIVAAVLIVGVATAIVPTPVKPIELDASVSAADVFAEVQIVMQSRCVSCHAQSPTQAGFSVAPQGVMLETAEDVVRQAQSIYQQVVVTKAMPIGNLTQITDEERALVGQWYQSGAKAR